MKKYSHLTYEDRLRLYKEYYINKRSISEIAYILDKHYNCIYYELHRKGVYFEYLDGETWETELRYSPELAQKQYEDNLRAKGAGLKIGNDYKLASYIEDTILEKKYSPQAVIDSIHNSDDLNFSVDIRSKTTIYSYIRKGVFFALSMSDCSCPRKKQSKEKVVRNRKVNRGRSIELRPKEIDDRENFGHWEMDTVKGKASGGSACLLVLTERKTRYEIVRYMSACTKDNVLSALDNIEQEYKSVFPNVFHTITSDNGSEFADFLGIEKSFLSDDKRVTHFYCHPYTSCERGSNENQNRFIRRWYKKGIDFKKIMTHESALKLQDWINDYPRRLFKGKSSKMMFLKELEQFA